MSQRAWCTSLGATETIEITRRSINLDFLVFKTMKISIFAEMYLCVVSTLNNRYIHNPKPSESTLSMPTPIFFNSKFVDPELMYGPKLVIHFTPFYKDVQPF